MPLAPLCNGCGQWPQNCTCEETSRAASLELVYENASECVKLLEAAGMGKTRGNCLIDMVREIIELNRSATPMPMEVVSKETSITDSVRINYLACADQQNRADEVKEKLLQNTPWREIAQEMKPKV